MAACAAVSPGAGSRGGGAITAAGTLGIAGKSGLAAGSARGVFRKTGGGTDKSVLVAALTGFTVAAGTAALVRPARALRRACWRIWSLFVPNPARAPSAGPPEGGAKKGGGWAHKLQPIRNNVRSVAFTVIWLLGLPLWERPLPGRWRPGLPSWADSFDSWPRV